MVRPFDISKFRKDVTKTIDGIEVGFNDPTDWVSTGNFLLNYRISGDFFKGIPLGKVTILAGESGAGKSYIASGNVIKNAQKQDIFVVLIDSENSLDEQWLEKLGVDTSEDKMLRLSMTMIDDVAKVITTFMKEYKDLKEEEKNKVLFVIDSLGSLLSPTEVAQFESGDMKGDMGRKAKQLRALVLNCINLFGNQNVGMICTNHTYQSQDMFDPDDKVSGGSGPIYAASVVVAMKKTKLKHDNEGKKTSKVHGIKTKCKIMKTRFTQPFQEATLLIPYETGMDPYSGLIGVDAQNKGFFEELGIIEREGNRLSYTTNSGEKISEFRKDWTPELLDMVMKEYADNIKNKKSVNNIDLSPDESEEEIGE